MPRIYLVLVCLFWFTPVYAHEPVISIIIDDMGYQIERDREVLSLSGPITYSILPNTPGVSYILKTAKMKGGEVMLHLPMESGRSSQSAVPGTLTSAMDLETFIRTLHRNLAAVPGIVAVNNHEGSRLTADFKRMLWLMRELSHQHDIAFVDSRTTRHSKALKAARKYGVSATSRDIFLDHEPGNIAEQFDALIKKAKQEGTALAIAHPREETLAFLQTHLGRLEQLGVELVPLSRLIDLRQQAYQQANG